MNKIRKAEIEQLTMQILRKYHITENPGKNIEKIILGEKIKLFAYDKWKADECGRFLYIDDEPVIFYNVMHAKEMRAFTIAHELGHYFLHHLDDSKVEIVCLNRDFYRLDDSNEIRLQREVEANYFASCLLLPLEWLTPVFLKFMKGNNRNRILYVDTQQCNFMDYKRCIFAIQMYFLASGSAIRHRLVNLGWMEFNIQFKPDEDRGVGIAAYLRNHRVE